MKLGQNWVNDRLNIVVVFYVVDVVVVFIVVVDVVVIVVVVDLRNLKFV